MPSFDIVKLGNKIWNKNQYMILKKKKIMKLFGNRKYSEIKIRHKLKKKNDFQFINFSFITYFEHKTLYD